MRWTRKLWRVQQISEVVSAYWVGQPYPHVHPLTPASPSCYRTSMMYGSMTTTGNSKLSVVQEKGQVTIPSEIREKLGLKKGDFVAFVETTQGVLITPREVVATETLAKIGALLKEQGI